MEDFEYSVEISDRDWECFFAECEHCNLLPPSLASLDDSGMSDLDDTASILAKRAQKVDQTAGFSEADRPIDGPPDCEGSPVEHYLSKHGVGGMESVLSGSEEDIHLQCVNIFFERLKNVTEAERLAEPSQAGAGKNREATQEEERCSDGQQAKSTALPKNIPKLNSLPARGDTAVGKETTKPVNTISNIMKTMKKDEPGSNISPEPAACSSVLKTNKSAQPETKLFIMEEACTETRVNEATQQSQSHDSPDKVETTPHTDKVIKVEICTPLDDAKQENLLTSQLALSKKCSTDPWGNLEMMTNLKWKEDPNFSQSDAASSSKTVSQESSPSASVKRKRRKRRRLSFEPSESVHGYERQSLVRPSDSEEEQYAWRGGTGLCVPEDLNLYYLNEPQKNAMSSLTTYSATSNLLVKIPTKDLSHYSPPCYSQYQNLPEIKVSQGRCEATGLAESNASNDRSVTPLNQTDDGVLLASNNGGNMATNLQPCSKLQVEESTGLNEGPGLPISSAHFVNGKSDLDTETTNCGRKDTHAGSLRQSNKNHHHSIIYFEREQLCTAEVKSLTCSILPSAKSSVPTVEVSQNDKLSAAKSVLAEQAGHSGRDSYTLCQRETEPQQQLEIDSHYTDQYNSRLGKTHLPLYAANGMNCSDAHNMKPEQFKTRVSPFLEEISTQVTLDTNSSPPDKCCLSKSLASLDINLTVQQTEHSPVLHTLSKLDVLSEKNRPAEKARLAGLQVMAFHNRNRFLSGEMNVKSQRETKSSISEDFLTTPSDITPISSCCTLDTESVMSLSNKNITEMPGSCCSSVSQNDSRGQGEKTSLILDKSAEEDGTSGHKSQSVSNDTTDSKYDVVLKVEDAITASKAECEPEKAPDSKHSVAFHNRNPFLSGEMNAKSQRETKSSISEDLLTTPSDITPISSCCTLDTESVMSLSNKNITEMPGSCCLSVSQNDSRGQGEKTSLILDKSAEGDGTSGHKSQSVSNDTTDSKYDVVLKVEDAITASKTECEPEKAPDSKHSVAFHNRNPLLSGEMNVKSQRETKSSISEDLLTTPSDITPISSCCTLDTESVMSLSNKNITEMPGSCCSSVSQNDSRGQGEKTSLILDKSAEGDGTSGHKSQSVSNDTTDSKYDVVLKVEDAITASKAECEPEKAPDSKHSVAFHNRNPLLSGEMNIKSQRETKSSISEDLLTTPSDITPISSCCTLDTESVMSLSNKNITEMPGSCCSSVSQNDSRGQGEKTSLILDKSAEGDGTSGHKSQSVSNDTTDSKYDVVLKVEDAITASKAECEPEKAPDSKHSVAFHNRNPLLSGEMNIKSQRETKSSISEDLLTTPSDITPISSCCTLDTESVMSLSNKNITEMPGSCCSSVSQNDSRGQGEKTSLILDKSAEGDGTSGHKSQSVSNDTTDSKYDVVLKVEDAITASKAECEPEKAPDSKHSVAFHNRNTFLSGEMNVKSQRETKSSISEDLLTTPSDITPISSCCTLDTESVMSLSNKNITEMPGSCCSSVSQNDSRGEGEKTSLILDKSAEGDGTSGHKSQSVSNDTTDSKYDVVLKVEDAITASKAECEPEKAPDSKHSVAFHNRNPLLSGEMNIKSQRETKSSISEDLLTTPSDITPISSCCTLDTESVTSLSNKNITEMPGSCCSSVSQNDSRGQGEKTSLILDKSAEGDGTSGHKSQSVSNDTTDSKYDMVLKVEDAVTASKAECEPEKAPDSKQSVFAMSSFWSEMEKLTINDILGLRMCSSAGPTSTLPPLQESEETDVFSMTDSGFFTQLDESRPEQNNEDLSSNPNSVESSSGSVSPRGFLLDSEPVPISLGADIYTENMLTSVGDISQPLLTGSAQKCLRKICKNVSVHNLPALESFSYTLKGQTSQTLDEGELEKVEYFTDEHMPKQDKDINSVASSASDSGKISLTDIFQYLFGERQSNPSQPATDNITTYHTDGNSVPETYDHFFSEFNIESFFYPLITADQSKDELVPVFSYSRSANRNLQFPEAYDHFFASSSSDDSSVESDEEDNSPPVRVVSRFTRTSSSSKLSTDIYDNFFTDSDLKQNFFWKNTLSFRNVSFTGSAVQKQTLSNSLVPVRQRSGRSLRRTVHPMDALGNQDVMFSDPLLIQLEDRISRQLAQQPFRYEDLETAVSNPRLDASFLPLRQSDMCLVCIAFASWVLKTANPQVGDAWKAVLLANVSALSAIRYLRKYVKTEAADSERKLAITAPSDS